MSRTLFAIGLVVAAAVVQAAGGAAQDPWYDVELIVFEYKGPPGDGSELWSVDPGTPDLDNAAEPVVLSGAPPDVGAPTAAKRGSPAPVAFQVLDASTFKLKAVEGRLERSTAYAPLLHVAWRQPISSAPAKGVRVHGGPGAGEGVDTIDGVVRLSRGRFLQAGIDLLYRKPGGEAVTGDASSHNMRQANVFRLQQAKRIRGGETTYFDHPRFGALLLLTPFDAQAKKATANGSEGSGAIDE